MTLFIAGVIVLCGLITTALLLRTTPDTSHDVWRRVDSHERREMEAKSLRTIRACQQLVRGGRPSAWRWRRPQGSRIMRT